MHSNGSSSVMRLGAMDVRRLVIQAAVNMITHPMRSFINLFFMTTILDLISSSPADIEYEDRLTFCCVSSVLSIRFSIDNVALHITTIKHTQVTEIDAERIRIPIVSFFVAPSTINDTNIMTERDEAATQLTREMVFNTSRFLDFPLGEMSPDGMLRARWSVRFNMTATVSDSNDTPREREMTIVICSEMYRFIQMIGMR